MKGNIFKKGNRYYIRYDLGKDSDGKRIQKVESGFDTKRQAEKVLRERITELEGSFSKKVERCTVAVYLQDWLTSYCQPRLARNTIAGYRVNIEKHIVPHIGSTPLYKLQPEQIQKMYDKLSANQLSSTTILYVHSVLRKALNTAIKRRVLTRNPIDYVDAPLKSRYKATVLSSEQVNTLFHSLGHDAISMAVLLAVTLGLRRGEVLGLKWSDFDLSSKTITICRTANFYHKELVLSDVKTPNSNRSLCLADELVHLLEEYHQQQTQEASRIDHYNPENLILCDKLGNPITTNVLNKRFKSILQQANLPAIRFHDLRHPRVKHGLKNILSFITQKQGAKTAPYFIR